VIENETCKIALNDRGFPAPSNYCQAMTQVNARRNLIGTSRDINRIAIATRISRVVLVHDALIDLNSNIQVLRNARNPVKGWG
jgi:hypothetical protein